MLPLGESNSWSYHINNKTLTTFTCTSTATTVRDRTQKSSSPFAGNRIFHPVLKRDGYPCPRCPSFFEWRQNLVAHLRHYCGKRPRYKCPYCDYISKVKTHVRRHVRGQHHGFDVYFFDLEDASSDMKKPML